MLNIDPPFSGRYAFLHTGFRPFFTAASCGAALLMLIWLGSFSFGGFVRPQGFLPVIWHAYEMIFGFCAAVVAGFLLTAVKNWTHLKTLEGYPLLGLLLTWLLARVFPFFPGVGNALAIGAEAVFLLWLGVVITRPLIQTKQWQHVAVVGKVLLLLPALLVFYLGLAGFWLPGMGVGLYAALYLLLGLLLTLSRRVMPMFIERGLSNGFITCNDLRVDRWSLVLFVIFALGDTSLQVSTHPLLSQMLALLAAIQAGLHGWRLAGWYHRGIWQKPLLWILLVGYISLILGFVLKAFTGLGWVSNSTAIHAFAAGALGLVTLGMMARVSLGHTGRNVNAPPLVLSPIFGLAVAAVAARVLGVALLPGFYGFWILTAQMLWVAAFTLFACAYLPIWIKTRIDGGRG